MSTRTKPLQVMLASLIAVTCAGSVFAANTARPECPAPTKETREKLAASHEEIAACLRSDKAITECRAEMAKLHKEMMHQMGCPGSKMHPHMHKQSQPSSPQ